MYHKKRLSQIKVMEPHFWSLKETLRPWWRITRCILLDWCYPYSDYEHVFVRVARYVSIIFVCLLLFIMTGFQLYRLVHDALSMTTIHSGIPYLIWFASLPITISTHLYYLYYRQQYLSFFEDWSSFEKHIALRNSHQAIIPILKKTRIFTIGSKEILKIGMLVALTYFVFKCPDAPYLLSYYQSLRDVLTLPVLGLVYIVTIILLLVVKALNETVPTLVFYHAGLEVQILQEEVERLFTLLHPSTQRTNKLFNQINLSSHNLFAIQVRQIFSNYNHLRVLVDRANSLFGSLIFQGYGMEFLVICTMLYTVLYQFQTSPETVGVFFTVLLVNLYDLVFCTMLTSKVYRASENLRTVLATLLNRYWDSIARDERDILMVILGGLRTDPFAATPLGLYSVTPSILLTMASLVVTYVIIMLQS